MTSVSLTSSTGCRGLRLLYWSSSSIVPGAVDDSIVEYFKPHVYNYMTLYMYIHSVKEYVTIQDLCPMQPKTATCTHPYAVLLVLLGDQRPSSVNIAHVWTHMPLMIGAAILWVMTSEWESNSFQEASEYQQSWQARVNSDCGCYVNYWHDMH